MIKKKDEERKITGRINKKGVRQTGYGFLLSGLCCATSRRPLLAAGIFVSDPNRVPTGACSSSARTGVPRIRFWYPLSQPLIWTTLLIHYPFPSPFPFLCSGERAGPRPFLHTLATTLTPLPSVCIPSFTFPLWSC